MRIPRACLATLFVVFAAKGEEVRISVLATTDLHGNLLPYDYYTARPVDRDASFQPHVQSGHRPELRKTGAEAFFL